MCHTTIVKRNNGFCRASGKMFSLKIFFFKNINNIFFKQKELNSRQENNIDLPLSNFQNKSVNFKYLLIFFK